mgnify:CR=1 FL=1
MKQLVLIQHPDRLRIQTYIPGMEGIAGVASTLCMCVGGFAVDKCSRVCVLRGAAIFAAAGSTVTLLTLFVLTPRHAHEDIIYVGLCAAQAINAIGRSLGMPAMEATLIPKLWLLPPALS